MRPCRPGLRRIEPRLRPRGESRPQLLRAALRPELRRAMARAASGCASSASIRASRCGSPPAWTTPGSSPTSSMPTSSTARPGARAGAHAAGLETVTPLCDPERAARITGPADLFAQTLIQSDNKQVRWTHWFERNRLTAPPPPRSASTGASWPWRRRPTGWASPSNPPARRAGDRRPAAWSRLWPGGRKIISYTGHHFVCPADARRRAPLRVFARWLARELAIELGRRARLRPRGQVESIHLRVQDSRLSRGRLGPMSPQRTRPRNVTARPPIPGSRSPASASVATTGFDPRMHADRREGPHAAERSGLRDHRGGPTSRHRKGHGAPVCDLRRPHRPCSTSMPARAEEAARDIGPAISASPAT